MEEILMEILSRLPVKSVIRFNCVSKFWNSLISQPYFKKKHLNHAKNELSSLNMIFVEWNHNGQFWCCSVSSNREDIPIFDCTPNSNAIDGIKIYSICDGFFLIGIWTDRQVEQPAMLVIWNPTTRQSIRLPHSKLPLQMEQMEDDLDDDRGSTYGLAYDSTSDDYKIFRIDISGKNDNEIFALKNGSWRIIDGKTSGRTDSRLLMGQEFLAFVNGAFHWFGFLSKVCVVTFNISNEMYEEISLPEILSSQLTLSQFDNVQLKVDVHVGVSELRGMLGVYYKDDSNFNLWAMKKYGIKDSWMKLFTISIADSVFYNIMPKYAFSDDEVLLCFDKQIWLTPDRLRTKYIYRIIWGGSSDRMFPQEDYDIVKVMDVEGDVYTESLIFPKLGH